MICHTLLISGTHYERECTSSIMYFLSIPQHFISRCKAIHKLSCLSWDLLKYQPSRAFPKQRHLFSQGCPHREMRGHSKQSSALRFSAREYALFDQNERREGHAHTKFRTVLLAQTRYDQECTCRMLLRVLSSLITRNFDFTHLIKRHYLNEVLLREYKKSLIHMY